MHVDCSKLDVEWLPDIKVYSNGSKEGTSLIRGQYSDTRDVQISLESMGNVLRMMFGGTDDDDEYDLDDIHDEQEEGGSCENTPQPPPQQDLDEIEEKVEDTPLLKMQQEDTDSPALEEKSINKADRKPKLAIENKPQLHGGREHKTKERISGFHKRETKRTGGGQLLGGGGGGSAGFIT